VPPPSAIRNVLAAACLLAPPAGATRYHVDADAAPGGDGLSWATAFDSLDAATALLLPGDRIWIAEGVYVPGIERVPGDPRSVTFHLPADVRLYGGFAGTEATLDQRAGLFDTTILSGELGLPGAADNAYHVVTVEHPSGIPPGGNRIDGVTIQGGNAADVGLSGGGVWAFNVGLRLEDVTLRDNAARNGGGVAAEPGALRLLSCRVLDNRATNNGAGVWGRALNLRVYSTTLAGNVARGKGGGAYLHSSLPGHETVVFANSVFHDNEALVGGGAFVGGGSLSYGIATFADCTFAFNRALDRGGALRANTTPALPARVWLHDSIVWGNLAPLDAGISGRPVVSYCDVQDGGWGLAHGNLEADPLFVDSAARDLRLAAGSPCIDAGDNALVARDHLDLDGDGVLQEPVMFDRAGLRRFLDDPATPDTGAGTAPIVDLGAYERR
jgi:hypothetical protein